ncbi:DUF6303 family protein [Streptomyces cinereoruber]|uniref:DUF6303 family protein n=1 Tax=Streptomyces cinereoruber TaxID=67260 RepID=UPI0036561C3A
MEIHHDGRPYQAAVACSGSFGKPGTWTLHLVDENGVTSDALMQWEPSPVPIPLLSRYDALALFGFAVVEGGAEAWTWSEATEGEGTYFVGVTPVRPLTDAERLDNTTPALERFGKL